MNPWIGLGIFIAAYDAWLYQSRRGTLSRHYKASCRKHPALMLLGTSYVLAHLCGALPERSDAFRGFGALPSRGDDDVV